MKARPKLELDTSKTSNTSKSDRQAGQNRDTSTTRMGRERRTRRKPVKKKNSGEDSKEAQPTTNSTTFKPNRGKAKLDLGNIQAKA